MPVDPDVIPLLDALATRVTALEAAGVKTHTHTGYAPLGHSHTPVPIPPPVPTPVPEPTPTPPPPVTLPDVPAGTDVNASEVVAKLAAAPNGTVFRVRPGTAGGTLTLKPGQQVWALDPASRPLFDGAGTQWFARGTGSAADTVLGYLRFRNYAPAVSSWVNVQGDQYRRTGGVQGDTLPNCRLYRCEGFENGWAVQGGNGMLVEECHLHHNHQMSMSANGKTGIVVKGGEWDNNNRRPDGQPFYNWAWEGGNKFVKCVGTVIDGLFGHHNIGPGIWFDILNDRCVIKNGRYEDNVGDGIFWEVSYQATIEDNDVHRNGNAANIYISNCRGKTAADPIHVRRNKTSGHRQWEIGLGNSGPRHFGEGYPALDFVDVRDNTVAGVIRQHTIQAPPVPTSIVWGGNKTPAGVAVGLTKSSQ